MLMLCSARLCSVDDSCERWTWVKSTAQRCGSQCVAHRCHLQDSTRGGIVGLPNFISGLKSCDGESCVLKDTESDGPWLDTLNAPVGVDSWKVCSVACKNNEACASWTWHPEARGDDLASTSVDDTDIRGFCVLHEPTKRQRVAKTGAISGDKSCQARAVGFSMSSVSEDWYQQGYCLAPSRKAQKCGFQVVPDYLPGEGRRACFSRCLRAKTLSDRITGCQYRHNCYTLENREDPFSSCLNIPLFVERGTEKTFIIGQRVESNPRRSFDIGFGECIYFTTEVSGGSGTPTFSCLVLEKPREAKETWPKLQTLGEKKSKPHPSTASWTAVQLGVVHQTEVKLRQIVLTGVSLNENLILAKKPSQIKVAKIFLRLDFHVTRST